MKRTCQNAAHHPDTLVSWEGQQRACPLCTARRVLGRLSEKERKAKDTLRQMKGRAEHLESLHQELEERTRSNEATRTDTVARLDAVERSLRDLETQHKERLDALRFANTKLKEQEQTISGYRLILKKMGVNLPTPTMERRGDRFAAELADVLRKLNKTDSRD